MPSRESQTVKRKIEIAGSTALGDAVAATRRYASDLRLGARDEARLCIIIEELVTNMIEHGGIGLKQPIAIEYALTDASVTLVIENQGPAFDPRRHSDGNDIPDRGGGAGLRLVAAWSEIVSYDSAGANNRLELRIPLSDG